eukprot:TRINITY_DN6450_c0_g1_i1.p1 TRINITY_DN6450_c0_g1~~TRINITY_DN6450_c0_g1_i1.p1  ORF type:complete len:564 (-),score=220.83 TRINITY_DN6450_c0_g1_i1:214-1905(-)
MSMFLEVKPEDLEGVEAPPEEIESLDQCEEKTVTDANSPFANLLGNILAGGGRERQGRIAGGSLNRNDPVVEDGKLYGQDFNEIKQSCLESGRLFTDSEFPPDDASMYFSQNVPYGVEWKRPREISSNPRLFVGGASRFDINQGELGDCWLLAALANLTMNKKFLYRIVPKDQSFEEEYAGVFHFQFWQYGEWVDVVIDDYLPTRFGKLMFIHSKDEDEYWTALIEKAYAKLHGSYEALKGGTTCEALVDFTGGCTEMYQLKERDVPRNLFQILQKAYERCSLKGCSMEPDPNVLEARTDVGLVRGHAYSITKVLNVQIQTPQASGKIPMMRIRNPWGNEAEWKGPFSDGSAEWQFIPDEEKDNIGVDFGQDGEFWMTYKDFMKYFDQLEICNLTPDSLENLDDFSDRPKWEVTTFHGAWVPGSTAGGCRNFINTFASNPQFRITVVDPDENDDEDLCAVIISVMQKGRRAMRDEGLDVLTIGFALYYLKDPSSHEGPLDTEFFRYNKSVGRSKAFINLREVSTRFRLPVGTYVIVPSTFKADDEGEFLIRVLTEKPAIVEEM